jgi:hypothetical protein
LVSHPDDLLPTTTTILIVYSDFTVYFFRFTIFFMEQHCAHTITSRTVSCLADLESLPDDLPFHLHLSIPREYLGPLGSS